MEYAVPMSKIVMKNWRENEMSFKCEKVDEELREKFYQEKMVLKEKNT